jgi:Protein of unknown function (DUF1203)
MPGFQLVGLQESPFHDLFTRPDEELRALQARRVVATEDTGFPCRVSLVDAAAGEELLLLPFAHQPADSPYRSSGPIFVRKAARQAVLPPGVVPPYVSRRLISLRAYDSAHLMVQADVHEGSAVADAIERVFADPAVAYIHLHNARRGCFSCRVRRA